MKLLMLKGLPASGKSTYAKELVAKGDWIRVNKDDLRHLLHGGKWSRSNEKEVIIARDALVVQFMEEGKKNVVVDDTNYHSSHEQRLSQLAEEHGYVFEMDEIVCDVEECIKRDLKRGDRAVGEQVIRKMWREYVSQPWEHPIVENSMPDAVIFDIDGTLARMVDRGPFEWQKVGNDELVQPVADLLKMFRKAKYKIIIFSGRDEECREITEVWLKNHKIKYDHLGMRPVGDNMPDYYIKSRLYNTVCNDYNIKYAVDDRLQVCRLWYEMGLCLLKVGDPDLEF